VSPFAHWAEHVRNARLRAAFAIGFLILFAFVGTFTYVNFVLVRPPLALGMMALGFVYLVFEPVACTSPAIPRRTRRRRGARRAVRSLRLGPRASRE
jgi:MFS transporter, YNFM family, putative membrane transport protein